MASVVRTGRVSAIDYKRGTYQVTYYDRGQSVTQTINAVSNGEYRMPEIGQIVSVQHNSNGQAAGSSMGTVWNHSNRPAEGFRGLYRKEYGRKKGQAYCRYDDNTGVFALYIDKRITRICNGEIYDEAKGAASFVAKKQMQLKSAESSVSIQAETGAGINAGKNITLEAGQVISLEAGGTISLSGEELKIAISGAEITIDNTTGGITIKSPTKIELRAPVIQEIRG